MPEEATKWEGIVTLCDLSQLNSELAVAYLKDVELELGTVQLKLAEADNLLQELSNGIREIYR